MPHLPPVEITGGSLYLEVPLNEVNNGNIVQTLFEIGNQSVKTYPEEEYYESLSKQGAVAEAVAEVADNGLLRKERSSFYPEPDDVTNPHQPRQFTLQRYEVNDTNPQIYLIEVFGANDQEILEFRPVNGKCKIKVYYAFDYEQDEVQELMYARRWPRPDLEAERRGTHSEHSGHSHPDHNSGRRRGIFHSFVEWLRTFFRGSVSTPRG